MSRLPDFRPSGPDNFDRAHIDAAIEKMEWDCYINWNDFAGLKRLGLMYWIANLQYLRTIIDRTPDTGIKLDNFTDSEDSAEFCGTNHCTFGWAALDPNFSRMGIMLKWDDDFDWWRPIPAVMDINYPSGPTCCLADQLFGPPAFGVVFAAYGDGLYDHQLLEDPANSLRRVSNKELALFRIDRSINKWQEWLHV